MDARERLRRYLEQRRELGERELVLDDMSVDEVMRMLGARPGPPADREAPPRRLAASPVRADEAPPREDAADPPASPDWRTVLEAAGSGPGGVARPAKPADPSARAEPPAPRSKPSEPRQSPEAPPPVGPSRPAPPATAPTGIVVGATGRELFAGPTAQLATIEEIAATVAECTRCPLFATAKNPVPGEGNPDADLVCVGEAPGATEDETGRPFVGESGQLLTKILAAINLRREDVFICNVLKHRPPGNRNPAPGEVAACSPYLVRQLELIRPKVVVAFGTFAAQTLLDTKLTIGKLRGSVHTYYGIPLIVTYHPAALLRNPAWKRPTWEDVQLARRILDSAAGA